MHAKRPLANLVRALLKAPNRVGCHEDALVIFVVIVRLQPQGPAVAVKRFPKDGHGFRIRGGVRVRLFPSVHGKGGRVLLVHDFVGMFRLFLHNDWLVHFRFRRWRVLGRLFLLGRLADGRRRRRGLTGREQFLLAQHDRANDGGKFRLIDAGGEPARHVRVVLEVVLVAGQFERVQQGARDANVGAGDLVAHQVGAVEQVRVQNTQGVAEIGLGLFVAATDDRCAPREREYRT